MKLSIAPLDSKKIELARLQGPASASLLISSSLTSRRLPPDACWTRSRRPAPFSASVTKRTRGRLKQFAALERTSRSTTITKDSFVRLYPYVPYQIELCVDIVAGLRLRRGAHRHVGGSNRTIIKQAQELMINPRTRLGEAPIGRSGHTRQGL